MNESHFSTDFWENQKENALFFFKCQHLSDPITFEDETVNNNIKSTDKVKTSKEIYHRFVLAWKQWFKECHNRFYHFSLKKRNYFIANRHQS